MIKLTSLLFTIALTFNIQAQDLQISLGSSNGIVLGDMNGTNLANNTNAFLATSFSSNLEIMYYKNNLGVGLRGSFMSYLRDKNKYEDAVVQEMSLTDGNYDFRYTNAFLSFSTLVGASYQFRLTEKIAIEPYIYVGFKSLTSPYERTIYNDGTTTFTAEKDPQVYFGFNYIPGLKFQWDFAKHFGVALFGEFDGASLQNNNEKTITYSSTSFNSTEISKSYNPQSLNLGINLSVRFGNCFKCKKPKEQVD